MAGTKSIYNNIAPIVNDAVEDAIGKGRFEALPTDDFVSMGKAVSDYDAYESYYKALLNRITRTVIYVKTYKAKTRGILRSEDEFGAYVQRAYLSMPIAEENPAYGYIDTDSARKSYNPHDHLQELDVEALLFGGQGTWTTEITMPNSRIKSAFLSITDMAGLIDAIYLKVRNAFELQKERIIAMCDNTGIANAYIKGKSTNLISEYNSVMGLTADNKMTVAKSLTDKEFLRFVYTTIAGVKRNFMDYTALNSPEGYETVSNEDDIVLEVLNKYAIMANAYLASDTYHKDLVSLPLYEEVNFWQSSGKKYNFADISKVSVKHKDFVSTDNAEGIVTLTGVIAVLKDKEYTAAYFGKERTWSVRNDREDTANYGVQATKGYAVDGHANCHVFYIADEADSSRQGELFE